MDNIVSSIDSISDGILYSLSLEPWFTIGIEYVSMRSEEVIIHSNLIHSDPNLLICDAKEAWNISSAKESST